MRLIDADALIKTTQHAGFIRRSEIETAPTVGGWISVKDRLPNENRSYLVCNMSCRNAVAFVAGFSTCLENVDEYNFEGEKRPGWFSYDDEYGFYEIDGVTHWMPLPIPPGGES